MKKYEKLKCEIVNIEEYKSDIYDYTLNAPQLSRQAVAGQFVHIYVSGHTLRRPVSICEIDEDAGTIRLVFQVRGDGTRQLAQSGLGDKLDILAPLGTGFPLLKPDERVILVGGGIGTPPLLEVAKYYGKNATVCLGFRDKDSVILEKDFKSLGAKVLLATEDGSMGHKGYVSDLFKNTGQCNCIYACGPSAMLHAVCDFAKDAGIGCYISLEERMACGIGACLGCACTLLDENGETYYGHICKEGPVFDYKRVYEYC